MQFSNRSKNISASLLREIMKATSAKGIISFAGGLPPKEALPISDFKKVFSQVFEKYGEMPWQYYKTDGVEILHEEIIKIMAQSGVQCASENILVTNGSQEALSLLALLFLDQEDSILVERPTYLAALQSFNLFRPNYTEVEMNDDGICLEDLEQKIKTQKNFKFLYTIPIFQNPTGRSLAENKKEKLVQLAQKNNLPIIEDFAYNFLDFQGKKRKPLIAFDPEFKNVMYLGTFSKTLSPGLRTGYLIAHPKIIKKVIEFKQASNLHHSTLCQCMVAEYLKTCDYKKHLKNIQKIYLEKKEFMEAKLKEAFGDKISLAKCEGGMFLWGEFTDKKIDTGILLEKTLERKMAFAPGSGFFANNAPKNTFRLNFSKSSFEEIEAGVTILKEAVEDL